MTLNVRARRSVLSLPEYQATWGRRLGAPTAGRRVDVGQAQRLVTAGRCVELLTNLVAGPEWAAYKQRADGTTVRLTTQPSIVTSPSALVRPSEWRKQFMRSLLWRGNGVGWIADFDRSGWPSQVEITPPQLVTIRQPDGVFSPAVYKIGQHEVPAAQIWHTPVNTDPGSVVGVSPVEVYATTIGVALATMEMGAEFYGEGGQPTALLSTDQALERGDLAKAKDIFREGTRGDRLAALSQAWTYQRISLTPAEALFLEAIAATDAMLCRIWGIPTAAVDVPMQSTSSLSYSNRESRALDLLIYTVIWWMLTVEEAMSALLPRGQFIRVDEGVLMRLDPTSLARLHDVRIRQGSMTQNEARLAWNEEPLPNGQGNEALWPPYSVTPEPPQAKTKDGTDGSSQPA